MTNSWQPVRDPWNESSIRMLLGISSMSPAFIVIHPKKNEKAWNPAGEDIIGPAQVSYTQINDDITVHVDRKAPKPKKTK